MCAIIANDSAKIGVVYDAPPEFFDKLIMRESQIAIGEMFAIFLAFVAAPKAFANVSSINFVDNMGVIHTVVNGASSQIDQGSLTMALHRKMAALCATIWWEYVPSQSNISDGGSRTGVTCELAKQAGIELSYLNCKPLPVSFPFVMPREWDLWWPN